MLNHVNIVSLDLFIHTPLINMEDRELCYFSQHLGWISYWFPVWEEVGGMHIIDPIKFPATGSWMNTFLHHPGIGDKLPAREAMIEYFQKRNKDISESN